MKPLVSVIVPIYKVEEDLENCVYSIINQTYANLEIILVDDGSPDRCPQIADELAMMDKRIVVIHKTNGGLSDARNAGIEVMKGEYVTFIDSDDIVEAKFVEKLMNLIEKYDVDVSVCSNSVFNRENGIVYKNASVEEFKYTSQNAVAEMLYQKGFDVSAWAKLYKASCFTNVRYPKGFIHEDIPTTYKAILNGNGVARTTQELYRYQIRANSIENEKFTLKKMDCIACSEMMLDDIWCNYQGLINAARSRYFAANMHILAQIHEKIPEKRRITNNIKKVRKSVLFDRDASVRVRCACLLTYISMTWTVVLLNMLNKRKYF